MSAILPNCASYAHRRARGCLRVNYARIWPRSNRSAPYPLVIGRAAARDGAVHQSVSDRWRLRPAPPPVPRKYVSNRVAEMVSAFMHQKCWAFTAETGIYLSSKPSFGNCASLDPAVCNGQAWVADSDRSQELSLRRLRRRAAALYSLIESAKLNGLNPQLYIADVLARIADHPARHIADLLPWNWKAIDITRAAALGRPDTARGRRRAQTRSAA
jgi:hypothetical protein